MTHPMRHGGTPAGQRTPTGQHRSPAGQRRPPAGRRQTGRQAPSGTPVRGAAAGGRWDLRLTGRGALIGMFAVFFVGLLISGGLDWMWLAGVVFVAASAAAARYTNSRDLLPVAASPPLLFGCALLATRLLTGSGNLVTSVAEGSLLTLASVAPWLFAGVAANLVIATLRGLPGCIRELRGELRTAGGYQPAQPRRPAPHTRRPTPQ